MTILYASSHTFSNFTTNLSGGSIPIVLPDVPEVVNFYASSHIWGNQPEYTLKGGTPTKPLFGSYGATSLGIPGISGALCDKYAGEIDGLLDTLGDVRNGLSGPVGNLKNELGGLVGQPASDLNDISSGISNIESTVGGAMPPIPDTSNIENILKECGIFSGSLTSGLSSVVSLIKDFVGFLFDLLKDVMNLIFDALGYVFGLIESVISFIADQIKKLLELFGLDKLLSRLSGLFDCLAAICGKNFDIPSVPNTEPQPEPDPEDEDALDTSGIDLVNPQSQQLPFIQYVDDSIAYVDNMLNDMNLTIKGAFDMDNALADFNLPQQISDNIKNLDKTVEDVQTAAKEQIAVITEAATKALNTVTNPPKAPITTTVKNYYT